MGNQLAEYFISSLHWILILTGIVAFIVRTVKEHLDSTRSERYRKKEIRDFLKSATINLEGEIRRENATEWIAKMLYFKKFWKGRPLNLTINTAWWELTCVFSICEVLSGLEIPVSTKLELWSLSWILIASSGTRWLRTAIRGGESCPNWDFINEDREVVTENQNKIENRVSEILNQNAYKSNWWYIWPKNFNGTFSNDLLLRMGLVDKLITE